MRLERESGVFVGTCRVPFDAWRTVVVIDTYRNDKVSIMTLIFPFFCSARHPLGPFPPFASEFNMSLIISAHFHGVPISGLSSVVAFLGMSAHQNVASLTDTLRASTATRTSIPSPLLRQSADICLQAL